MPPRGPIEQEILENLNHNVSHIIRAKAHGDLKNPPREFLIDGLKFKLEDRLYTPERGLWVSLSSKNAEVDPDGYFFPNPPIKVPDGTTRKEYGTDGVKTVDNFVEDVRSAFIIIVSDAAKHYASHPDVWGNTTTTVFSSTDGYIESVSLLNYSEARTGGGTLNPNTSSSTMTLGQKQEGEWYVYEAFVSWNTSSIPDTDLVSSVVLSLDGVSNSTSQDFTMEARSHSWTADGLTGGDWVSGANLGSKTLLASLNTSAYSSSYMDFTSDAAFPANISKTSTTQIILCSDRQRLNNAPVSEVLELLTIATSEASGTSTDPKLVINHGAGSVPRKIRFSGQSVNRAATF